MRYFIATILIGITILALSVFTAFKFVEYRYNKKELEKIKIEQITRKLEEQRIELEKPATATLVEEVQPFLMEQVKAGETFVYVNLDEMQLTLIHEGDAIKSYKVLSIRKIGSKFDTPTGEFEALTKEENHFSTIGHVWMPYSVQFFGNYFIHGWPYYPNGDPVPPGYSGGCVRMATEDMAEIYDFIKLGMKIVIE